MLERARAAVPTLSEHAARTERDLRPAPESVAAVRQAGLFALTVPRDAGGLDVDLRTFVGVVAELGRGCPSTAWVTAFSAGAKMMAGTVLPDEARHELFADPDAIVSSSGVMVGSSGHRVPGGLRITGRWRMASSSEVATWAVVIVPVLADDGPATVCPALVPTVELTIERSWQAVGLAGTSSHTLVADDVFVPTARVAFPPPPPGDASAAPGGPPARGGLPAKVVFGAGMGVLAPVLGAARGALDVVEEMFAGPRAPFGTIYQRLVDSPLARYWFTEATFLVDSATRRTLRVADVVDALGPDEQLPPRRRADLRMDLTTAAQELRGAMEKLLDLHGASGFAQDNPLQRFWRDVAVGTRHPYLMPHIVPEEYGRLLFDLADPVLLML
ncbi:hypothetical protein UK82_01435 [Frankia sp. ACN1ag]|nr:hypothetical protein UK82_01435 [Frankia sp. ACN1ag]